MANMAVFAAYGGTRPCFLPFLKTSLKFFVHNLFLLRINAPESGKVIRISVIVISKEELDLMSEKEKDTLNEENLTPEEQSGVNQGQDALSSDKPAAEKAGSGKDRQGRSGLRPCSQNA
ncbi:hypothetical protein VQ056_04945 [Paenibacillus sp. JTLBN-2024]